MKYPNSLPAICGFIGLVISASYYLSLMVFELVLAEPTSTWILGIFWLPFLVYKPAIIGFLIGFIIWLPLRILHKPRPISDIEAKYLKILILLSVLLPVVIGFSEIIIAISRYNPKIVYTTGNITKLHQIPFENYTTTNAHLTWKLSDEKSSSTPISWNDNTVFVIAVSDAILLTNNQNKELGTFKFDDVNYLSELYAIPIRLHKERPESLAVLVKVRAIVRRPVLLIFNSQGKLIYQEIFREKYGKPNPMQRLIDTISGKEVLMLNMESPLIYAGNGKF